MRPARFQSSVRKLHESEEEVIDLPDRLSEEIEAYRFGDVGVGVQPVAGRDVRIRLGGGEYHHGDGQQVRSGLQVSQHLQAVTARQVSPE